MYGEFTIRGAFLGRAAILLGLRRARSRRPFSASGCDSRPGRRSWRRSCRGGRIGARQAPVADPESFSKTVAQSPPRRSGCRRPVCALHPPGPVDPFRDRLEAVNAVEPSSNANTAEVSQALLIQGPDEAWPQGTERGSRCRRRRHETTEPDLGLSTDRATDHTGLRYSHQQGRGASHSCGSVPPETRRGGAVLAHGPGSREGQSVESGSVSVRIGRPPYTLGGSW